MSSGVACDAVRGERWCGKDDSHEGEHPPPSPSHTFELSQQMKKDNVKIIIIEPYFDSKTPNAIGRDTGAQVVTLAPSVGGAKGAPVADYFQLFDYDVNTLVAAFKAAGVK